MRTLIELLKKREEDGMPQETHGVHVRESKGDTWERTTESYETVGMEIRNQEGRHLEARLMDAVRRIQKEQLEDGFGIGDGSPIFAEILAESFLEKFKLPSLDKYDGKTNPRSHMANFFTIMLLQNVNDIVRCKVLPNWHKSGTNTFKLTPLMTSKN